MDHKITIRHQIDAVRAYADYLEVEDDIIEMIDRADADMAAGRDITVSRLADNHALQDAAITRLAQDVPGI